MRLESSLRWLLSACAVSTYGTWIAFGAFPLIMVRVLHASPFAVSLLDAVGLAGAAVLAVPIGPWVAHRTKRSVLVAMDLIRFVAMGSVPIGYLLGFLSYVQLLVVSIVVATSSIAFGAASGAYLNPSLTVIASWSRTAGLRARVGRRPPWVRRSAGFSSRYSVRSSRSPPTPSAI